MEKIDNEKLAKLKAFYKLNIELLKYIPEAEEKVFYFKDMLAIIEVGHPERLIPFKVWKMIRDGGTALGTHVYIDPFNKKKGKISDEVPEWIRRAVENGIRKALNRQEQKND